MLYDRRLFEGSIDRILCFCWEEEHFNVDFFRKNSSTQVEPVLTFINLTAE